MTRPKRPPLPALPSAAVRSCWIKPIKDLGIHSVSVVLHPEVIATVKLNVARSVEEAELQASGKSIQELAAEAEAAAEFEIAELFDDMGAAQEGENLTRD